MLRVKNQTPFFCFVLYSKISGYIEHGSFFSLKKKNQKILDEKIAQRKASSRSLIFRRPQPAPFLTDHFSLDISQRVTLHLTLYLSLI